MGKYLAFIFVFLFQVAIAAEQWPPVKFAHVVAYCYDYKQDDEDRLIVQKDGRHHPGIISPATVRLSEDQVAELRKVLSEKAKKYGGSADCFWPHHAFVFYDEKWTPVAHMSVCFTCGTFKASSKGVHRYFDMARLQKFVETLKVPVFKVKSPSEKGEYTKLFERLEGSNTKKRPER